MEKEPQKEFCWLLLLKERRKSQSPDSLSDSGISLWSKLPHFGHWKSSSSVFLCRFSMVWVGIIFEIFWGMKNC